MTTAPSCLNFHVRHLLTSKLRSFGRGSQMNREPVFAGIFSMPPHNLIPKYPRDRVYFTMKDSDPQQQSKNVVLRSRTAPEAEEDGRSCELARVML